MGFIQFLKTHVLQSAMMVIGPIMFMVSITLEAHSLTTMGIPNWCWQIAGAVLFSIGVVSVLYGFHRQHYGGSRGDAAVQPLTPSLRHVYSQYFASCTVEVDNAIFYQCTFTNVTFRWSGAAFYFKGCKFDGVRGFVTNNQTIKLTVEMLRGLSLLEPEFAASWHDLPADHFSLGPIPTSGTPLPPNTEPEKQP